MLSMAPRFIYSDDYPRTGSLKAHGVLAREVSNTENSAQSRVLMMLGWYADTTLCFRGDWVACRYTEVLYWLPPINLKAMG